MITIFASAVLSLGLLFYVFYSRQDFFAAPHATRLAYLRERKDAVYENLRDLNFEFKAGKFSQSDYESLRASLEDEAALLLSEIERLEATGEDEVNA